MTTAALATSDPTVPALVGEMKFSKKDGALSQDIEGSWAFSQDAHAQSEYFHYRRTIDSTAEPGKDINGKYSFDGQFKFKGDTLHESGVIIVFEKTSDGTFSVQGRGKNEFGVFRLDGTANKSDQDELSYEIKLTKHYIVQLGSNVSQYFSIDGGFPTLFEGTIDSYDADKDRYTILYEDGGKEELEEEETIKIVLEALNPTLRGRKARKQKHSAQAPKANKKITHQLVSRSKQAVPLSNHEDPKLSKNIHAIAKNQNKMIDEIANCANTQSKMIGILKSRADNADENLRGVSEVLADHEKMISHSKDRLSRIQKFGDTKTNNADFDRLQAKVEQSFIRQSKRMDSLEKGLSAVSGEVKNLGRSLSGQQKAIRATTMRVGGLEAGLMERDMHQAKINGKIFTHLREHKGALESLFREQRLSNTETELKSMEKRILSTLKNEIIASSGTSVSAADSAYKDDKSVVIEDLDQKVNNAGNRKRKHNRNSLGPVMSNRHRKSSK